MDENNLINEPKKLSDLLYQSINEIQNKKDSQGGLIGIPSGFHALDRVTSGWQASELIVLAARPGMGKTSFILSALRNATIDFGHSCAIFSLEMSSIQLVNRLISAESELESEKIKRGDLAEYEWEQIVHKTSKLSEASILIDDTPAITVSQLRFKCNKLVDENGIKLVIVDYLQLMRADSDKKFANREQEIAHITRELKSLSKELNIPIIAVSQLNRAVETRGGDKRPQLSDLRDSGALEQDPDMIMFLYRPEYYGLDTDESGRPIHGLCEMIIAKQRNGRTDTVNLKFIGKYTKFTDWDENDSEGFGEFPSTDSRNSDFTITLPKKADATFPEVDDSPF